MAVLAATSRRNLVVIGTSAGGIAALQRLFSQLPGTFTGTIVVAIHQRSGEPSHLVYILQRSTSLPLQWAEQGVRLVPGHIHVSPPDTHVAVYDGHLRLSNGPRENFVRPSIDRLFRSAAAYHGSQTIGVLLTGTMADGVNGMLAIRDGGGRTIVQDPAEAEFNELPTRALAAFDPDKQLRLDAIGPALVEMTNELAPTTTPSAELALEAEIDRLETTSPRELDQIGSRVPQMCPECGGPMWQVGDAKYTHLRCYLGHAINARDMLDRSADQLETALWSAIRALHERATTWDALSCDARATGSDVIAADYAHRAKEAREQAELARRFMLELIRRGR